MCHALLRPQVRSCFVGERTVDTGDLCVSCGSEGLYSLSPTNITCDACPDDAYCNSTAGVGLVPRDGFWMSSLLSPQVGARCYGGVWPAGRRCTGQPHAPPALMPSPLPLLAVHRQTRGWGMPSQCKLLVSIHTSVRKMARCSEEEERDVARDRWIIFNTRACTLH